MDIFGTLWTGVVYTAIGFWICYRFIWGRMVSFTPSIWIDREGDNCYLRVRVAYTTMQPVLVENLQLASLWRDRIAPLVEVEGLSIRYSQGGRNRENYKPIKIEGAGFIEGKIDITEPESCMCVLHWCGYFPRLHIKLQHLNSPYMLDIPDWFSVQCDITEYLKSKGAQINNNIYDSIIEPYRNWAYDIPGACIGFLCGQYYRLTKWFPHWWHKQKKNLASWAVKWKSVREQLKLRTDINAMADIQNSLRYMNYRRTNTTQQSENVAPTEN